MIKKLLLSTAGMLGLFAVNAQDANQTISYCGKTEVEHRIFNDHYDWKIQDSLDRVVLEDWTELYAKNRSESERGVVYTIPTVFHIVHLGGVENITDAQVHDAMRILNEDFNSENNDTSVVIQQFKNIIGDAEMEFLLAKKDNSGNCISGITRTYSQNTYDQGVTFNGHPIVDDVIAEHGNFPSNKYMNIYVCIDPAGAAGYTNTPNNWLPINPGYAGIFISHLYVGAIGTGTSTRSRALTHEVGHWFNLQHPWGPNNNPGNAGSCSDDDGVSDTPNTIGWTTCNLNGNTCGSLDNVQNYMDYSYCSRMFTEGQATRMRAAATSNVGGRDNLWTTANLNATGVYDPDILCAVDFEGDDTEVCAGQTVTFSDRSFNGATGWQWTFPGGNPSTSTDSVVTVTYNTPGVYDVTLQATDGTTSLTETKTSLVNVAALNAVPHPLVEGFEGVQLPSSFWNIPGQSNLWEVTSAAAYTGSNSAYIDNSTGEAGNIHILESNPIDLSNASSVVVSFKYAYAQRNSTSSDKLTVKVSSNCGQSFVTRKILQGSALSTGGMSGGEWVPNGTGEWDEEIITNISSSFLVEGFRVLFEFESDGGNNLYIDDINIQTTLGTQELNNAFIDLNIFPNPAQDQANISFFLKENSDYQVRVFDMVGKEVALIANGTASGQQNLNWDVSGVDAGVYTVRIQIDGKLYTEKIVIE